MSHGGIIIIFVLYWWRKVVLGYCGAANLCWVSVIEM